MKLLRTLARGKGTTTRRQLLKALGVSAAAAPLVPALDSWAAPGARKLLMLFTSSGMVPEKWLQCTPTRHGMLHDVTVLLIVQRTGLVKHFHAHANLSDVMHAAAEFDLAHEFLGHTKFARDQDRIATHSYGVAMRVCVAEFKRVSQRVH